MNSIKLLCFCVNSLLSDEAALLENWLIKVQHKVSKSIAILKARHAMSEIERPDMPCPRSRRIFRNSGRTGSK
jgi:hypothetical protein